MADRERIETIASWLFLQLVIRPTDQRPFQATPSDDARLAIGWAETFISVMDAMHPPEQPAAPTPGEQTLLEAAKALIAERDSHQVDNRVALAVAWQDLRAAVRREEDRRG